MIRAYVWRLLECHIGRLAEYHRQKLKADPEYRQVARDSQKKWRHSLSSGQSLTSRPRAEAGKNAHHGE